MNNLALIPARSGSKGIKNKNIKLLNGLPLMAYSIKAALKSGVFSDVMVSTDSGDYAAIACKWGAEVPFLRSLKTSEDSSATMDAVLEVLDEYQKLGRKFDTVCILQPTSPLRDENDIRGAYRMFTDLGADAITSVCKVDHTPLWDMTLGPDLSLKEFRRNDKKVPRQLLDQYYRLNGAIYIRKIEYLQDCIKILEDEEYAYIMDRNKSVDIDTPDDFAYAQFMMSRLSPKY